MLVFAEGHTVGTIGGGRFESLAIEQAVSLLDSELPLLKTYPLHENDEQSFGAICGGESTVLFEPIAPTQRLIIVGAGHCSQAIAQLALQCGWHVTVVDDRADLLADYPPVQQRVSDQAPPKFIEQHSWRPRQALVIVSRNHEIDRLALAAAVQIGAIAYIGMIGSQRKVRQVFARLVADGMGTAEQLERVFAPIGLDIAADSPAEIAISVIAQILQVIRGASGQHLRLRASDQ